MSIIELRKKILHYWRTYGTLNNVVMLAALIIAGGWAWGSISMIQTNFNAQKSIDEQKRQLELTQLEVDTLKYQQNYYNTDEYKDLAAREDLGLATPGEEVLILPPNSAAAKQEDIVDTTKLAITSGEEGSTMNNFDQWINFLSGGMATSSLQKE